MAHQLIGRIDFQGGIDVSAPALSPASKATLSDGTWNAIVAGNGLTRPWSGVTSSGAGSGSTIMLPVGNTWGGIKDGTSTASGSFFEDIGKSRWGIGHGTPHIAGTSVSGFTLSTNLQVQVKTSGTYGTPVEAGLAQPSAPDIGITATPGDVSNSISAKIERTRPATGARSLASPSSAVIIPQANRVRVTFPAAAVGQTHWRVYFTFQGFGGTGVYYLATYLDLQDIPEAVVGAGTVGGSPATATGTLTVGTVVANSYITINGVQIYFRSTAPAAGEVLLGSSDVTATNLAAVLNESLNPLLSAATYTVVSNVITVTYGSAGTGGNSYALGNDNANITRSGAYLTGGLQGDVTRSLEFNYKDGDLIPIEASYDDYPPPAATHALRLQNVLNLIGCYADSTSDPTSASPGTAIAVSKENNYESYVPTHLLYLPEQAVDCMSRPMDDYGYVACQNSIHAIQYVGDRGDGLPPCTLTTVLPDMGIAYAKNWCQFKNRLVIYAGTGVLMMMDESGGWDTDFAGPVANILQGKVPGKVVVGYDPKNDSLVLGLVKTGGSIGHFLIYSLQSKQWRQVWLPDFSLTGSPVSCTTSAGVMYFTLQSSGPVYTAYSYDTGSSTPMLTFCSNYQDNGAAVANAIYEMALAVRLGTSTLLGTVVNRNMGKTVFRQIGTTNASANITDAESSFTSEMTGQKVIVCGTDVGGAGVYMIKTTVSSVGGAGAITLGTSMGATLTNALMLVGDFAALDTGGVTAQTAHLPNYHMNIPEARSYQVAVVFKSTGQIGNVLSADLIGVPYSSSRAL